MANKWAEFSNRALCSPINDTFRRKLYKSGGKHKHKEDKKTLPHAATVFKRIRPALKRPIKMAMHFMLPFPALINKSQLEQRPNIRTLTRQRDKNRNVSRIILRVFSIGVEVYRPFVASDGEIIARYVLPDAHSFGQGVALDHEPVRTVYGLGYGAWARRWN